MGRGVDIPSVGGQNTMGRGVDIPWLGGQNTMDMGGGGESRYHGWGWRGKIPWVEFQFSNYCYNVMQN